MGPFIQRFKSIFVTTAVLSLLTNLLLIVPSIYFLQVFDRVLTSRSNETLVMLSLLALVALVMSGALDSMRSRLLAIAAAALERNLGSTVLGAMLKDAATPTPAGNVHGLRDLGLLRSFLSGQGLIALFDLPWLPIYLLIIFAFHPLLGAVALSGSLALLALAVLNERRARMPLAELNTEARKASRFAELSLRNAGVVEALGMAPALCQHWELANANALKGQLDTARISSRYTVLTKSARQTIQMAMLAMGAYLVIDLNASSGIMIAATILLGRALAPIESVIAAWRSLVDARTAYGRLDELLCKRAITPTRTQLPVPLGELRVEQVVFGTNPQEPAILKGVSFQIGAGTTLAIIGPSASGKSTLARLLVGAWQPVMGKVRLDGADITGWSREDLGRHIGYLPQEVELFAASVSQNIARLGQVPACEVIEAAQQAGVHDMILRLPQGYDTKIGEGGQFLSGGQRQRIGLARALFGNPNLIVLDEPNASLDSEGEAALLIAVRDCKRRGATVILIAHRPSMLSDVDQVLVLREGRVARFGSRDEVLPEVVPGLVPFKPALVA